MVIGAQLYTVREFTQTEKDFEQTIKKIADIGYRYVQISGAGPIPPKRFAEICASYDVKPVITHTAPNLIKDSTDEVIENHRIMGAKYVGVGMMPGEYHEGAEGTKKFIVDFLPAAKKIRDAGLLFMYHNHAFEFEKVAGKLRMELLSDGFAPELMGFTLDTYWVQAGGGDPAQWLERLNGRVEVIHIKDMKIVEGKQRGCEIKEGNLNWPAIYAACEKAGVKYAMVEQDNSYGDDPFDCLKLSFENSKGDF